MLCFPPSFFLFVSLSLVFFQEPSLSACFINVMVAYAFILHLLLSVCTSLLVDLISSDGFIYHWCTHFHHPLRSIFWAPYPISTRQLSLNAQRHIRYNVKNSTNHISTQICVFVIKSMLLMSIKWPSQKLENILDFFSQPPATKICWLFPISQDCLLAFVVTTAFSVGLHHFLLRFL